MVFLTKTSEKLHCDTVMIFCVVNSVASKTSCRAKCVFDTFNYRIFSTKY